MTETRYVIQRTNNETGHVDYYWTDQEEYSGYGKLGEATRTWAGRPFNQRSIEQRNNPGHTLKIVPVSYTFEITLQQETAK